MHRRCTADAPPPPRRLLAALTARLAGGCCKSARRPRRSRSPLSRRNASPSTIAPARDTPRRSRVRRSSSTRRTAGARSSTRWCTRTWIRTSPTRRSGCTKGGLALRKRAGARRRVDRRRAKLAPSRAPGRDREQRRPVLSCAREGGRSEFHGDEGRLYYATARYLCFWLQQRGLLERFYREHRRRKGGGLDVLRDVTGMETTSLRTAWESFVVALHDERSAKVAGP